VTASTPGRQSLWDVFERKAALLGVTVVHAADAPAEPDADSGDVIGVAAFAVAETGSVLVCSANAERGRALLAERLCLVVHAEDIVANLDEALVRVGALIAQGNRYATFMSGPSRTADIERTLTIGVHGSGALQIVVLT
jgi:L-lactate dehydrogenase complex protein LldG